MKTNNLKYILAAGIVCCGLATTFSSCGDVLDEQPRSQFDPTFFNTKAGIEGGLMVLRVVLHRSTLTYAIYMVMVTI